MDILVKLTIKKLFQVDSCKTIFQKFVSLCAGQYGESFQVKELAEPTSSFIFHVDSSPKELGSHLNQEIIPQILPWGWKADTYELEVMSMGDGKILAAPRKKTPAPSFHEAVAAVSAYLAKEKNSVPPAVPEEKPRRSPSEKEAIAAVNAYLAKMKGIPQVAEPEAKPAEREVLPAEKPTEREDLDSKSLQAIFQLVGAHSFKTICSGIHDRAPVIRSNHTEKVFLSDAYLFSIGAGEGYSRALALFSSLMVEEGIISQPDINELTPPAPTDRELDERMERFLNQVEAVMEASRTISMDISQWIGRTGSGYFKKLLIQIFQKMGSTLVVFRVPVLSKTLIDQTKRDLDDIIMTKAVVFDPFTGEELRTLAKGMLKEYGFSADDAVWPYFDRKIEEEKQDGYFYGINTVRKLTNIMIRCAEEYMVTTRQSGNRIIPQMVDIWVTPANGGCDAMEELNALVGLHEIKQQILEIITQIQLSRKAGGKIPCMHMTFEGAAGTGKTTVARLLGKILNEKGILRTGNFYEYKGRDLCGRYVGETAIKTTAICQEAYGSVLFIDEAYSLYRGDTSTNDFGREAIDTLIAEMENHRDDMVVILTGYSAEIETLMDGNTGLRSRIPYWIKFPNYSPEALHEIFLQMIKENFTCDPSLEEVSYHYFTNLPETTLHRADFGNARFVRNLYERVWGKAAMRCTDVRLEDICITAQDFKAAVDAMEPSSKVKRTPLGFT